MIKCEIPILGFAAYSGTGKTTLLIRIIPLLKKLGVEVGVIKHAHHNFEIDHQGKDSYEIRKSGAAQILVGSKKRWALIVEKKQEEQDNQLTEYISQFDTKELDLILIEGFKPEFIKKIELHRPSLNKPLLCKTDKSIIAIATDEPLTNDIKIPILDLNNYESITNYIVKTFLPKKTIR